MRIGNREFDVRHGAHVMGILNVTPDSFSDGGRYNRLDTALHHAEQMVSAGAAVIDVGGESTRPGYTPVSDTEEIDRVAPVIEAIKARIDVPVSVDTYKSRVAEAALQAGCDMVNDIWGLKADPDMAALIARSGAACCLMHNRRQPVYGDFLSDVLSDLRKGIELAQHAGIREDGMLLDPGIGFAKDLQQNLLLTRRVSLLGALGYPVLLGTSRKSMIGLTLNLPRDQREEGTLATTVYGLMNGVSFFRVHDVQASVRAIAMTHAILDAE